MKNWEVLPYQSYYGEYKDKRRVIIEDIQRRDDLSIGQKLELLDQEMGRLKLTFQSQRRAEYESKSTTVTVEHSCTNGGSGKKDCGWKCAFSPSLNLYTKAEWVVFQGKNKGVQNDGNGVCIRMTRAGKGRNAGSATATFRWKPAIVIERLAHETRELFNLIADDGVDVGDFIDQRSGIYGEVVGPSNAFAEED